MDRLDEEKDRVERREIGKEVMRAYQVSKIFHERYVLAIAVSTFVSVFIRLFINIFQKTESILSTHGI